jgi:hypothetical protein
LGNFVPDGSFAVFWFAPNPPAIAVLEPESEVLARALIALADFRKLRRGRMDFGIWVSLISDK